MSRHLGTSIDAIEDWDIDKFLAYRTSLARVLKGETARTQRRR